VQRLYALCDDTVVVAMLWLAKSIVPVATLCDEGHPGSLCRVVTTTCALPELRVAFVTTVAKLGDVVGRGANVRPPPRTNASKRPIMSAMIEADTAARRRR
jgi:hypothetical protein